ncbi:MAG: GTPase HflX [Clostridia bacterium]
MADKVNGNTDGIKTTLLNEMAALYDYTMDASEFAPFEMLELLARFTAKLRREISVYISRDGRIVDVSIGDSGKVNMPNMRLSRNEDRLCGVRCIHTHPNGDGRLSGVDIGTLRSMRLDCMAALGVNDDGSMGALYAGYLGDMLGEERQVIIFGPMRPYKLPQSELIKEIRNADTRLKSGTKAVDEARPERAVLVGIENNEGYDTIAELAELAATAGAQVVGRVLQRRRDVDNATYIGSGKAEELSLLGSELEAELFIFDDELSAVQIRNLESIIGARVIDRTALILDIFASRAQSREGKLQVELAQLKYRLPRLLGQGTVLSRQGAGIGTRGPGEKKLEIDRRRIRSRITELKEELYEIEKQRGLRRERRERNIAPLVALVGYTNAGKSTLLNALTNAGVLAEDKLFATLDPVVRQVQFPHGTLALISDTVGFINKLPHDLVEAFKSTLEEVTAADLILHVVDCSSSYYDSQMAVVEDVLLKLKAGDTARINVYNKIDKLTEPPHANGACLISAKTGEGMEALLDRVEQMLNSVRTTVELVIPYDKYEAMTLLRTDGLILEEVHQDGGTLVKAQMDDATMWRLKRILGDVTDGKD